MTENICITMQALLLLLISLVCSYGFRTTSASFQRRWKSPNSIIKPRATLSSFDYFTETKIPWIETGYNSWTWKGSKINYLDVGAGLDENGSKKPALLLIHGFGASCYHWRYNVPILARKYHVYAIDLLGFGLSDKPIVDYSAETWKDQVVDFVQEVIGDSTVVAGNSLGGFTALYSAATDKNSLIKGCILLNAAGRFRSSESEVEKESPPQWLQSITQAIQRFVIGVSFVYTKQPARIAQVLRQVYPVDPTNVDDELVQSIQFPSFHPNAAEVFYRVIAKNGSGPPMLVDDLLETFEKPLMLLWGSKDPWIQPTAADKIQSLYPRASRVNVDAGHCPHDEAPAAVNEAIDSFMTQMYA